MTSTYAGALSATRYHPNILEARQTQGWDDYQYRLDRYEILDGYYHNMAYHRIKSYSQSLKVHEQLYKHVRGVYNPVKRLVDGYVSNIYGGVLDTKQAKFGAIPIETENDTLRQAIASKLWVDSRWGQKKSLYTRFGAKFGDSFIKIVDDIHKRQVSMEVVDPMKIKGVVKEPDGTIVRIEFEYYIRHSGRLIKYREIITPEYYESFGIGRQYDNAGNFSDVIVPLHTNGRNETTTKWDNDYGFVPVRHVLHTDEGLLFGASVAHAQLQKINEINDLASVLNDGMRRQVNLPLIGKNVQSTGSVDLGSDQSSNSSNTSDNPKKDTVGILTITGDNADLFPLPPTINIADGLSNIIEIMREIERDSPELALHRLRESGNLTAPGIRAGYADAINLYQESRGNYDTELIGAHKMACVIGGQRGYDGYQAFSGATLDDDRLAHRIEARPVINDTMSVIEKSDYSLRGMQQNAPKAYYLNMGLSDEDAEEFVEAGQAQRDSYMMTSPFETSARTPELDDPDATPQDAFDIAQNSDVNEADVINADQLLREVV